MTEKVGVESEMFMRPAFSGREIFGNVFAGFLLGSRWPSVRKFEIQMASISGQGYQAEINGKGVEMVIFAQPSEQPKENPIERAMERIYWEVVFSLVNGLSEKTAPRVPEPQLFTLENEAKTVPLLSDAMRRVLTISSEAELHDFEALLGEKPTKSVFARRFYSRSLIGSDGFRRLVHPTLTGEHNRPRKGKRF